jgi:hypothetical protein
MTLIKSKIDFLGWLKSAIYISVCGGVILSSKPTSAAVLGGRMETRTSFTMSVVEDAFGGGNGPLSFNGDFWKARVNVTQNQGFYTDILILNVLVQHITAPHAGDNPFSEELSFDFRLDPSRTSLNLIRFEETYPFKHAGRNHSDSATGILTATLSHDALSRHDIENWTFRLSGSHAVPEPTTMLAAALALGWGGWMKRKNSIK